jgi:uncharacterized protein (TIGR02466 family)
MTKNVKFFKELGNVDKIFPRPFLRVNVQDLVDKNEYRIIKDYCNDMENFHQNTGNFTSKDKHIFKQPFGGFKLYNVFNDAVNYFYKDVMGHESTNLKITQSWLNVSNDGDHHHHHAHLNSVVSGVFYMSSGINQGHFCLHKSIHYMPYAVEVTKNTPFNEETVFYNTNEFDMFLFLSDTFHSVTTSTADEKRVSLAFNSFYVGQIGSDKADALYIKDVSDSED